MKPLLIALAGLLLAGCQSQPSSPVADAATPALASALDADHHLLARERLCALPRGEQRLRLMELSTPGRDRGERFSRLLLASCNPEATPGLLRQALGALGDGADFSPGERALVALIRDQARSYRVLEERNAELAARLAETIDGIRDIEADMDNLKPERRAP
ncbi:MAG: hypothetical protein WDA10_08925 [Porticoccaceae bacterium]|jgi:hypothetical protein|nr:hypothetical protein [Porticoccaceae bacterium]MEA3300312.1 hypothetical protein [Pseudomonadota bacterium]HLS99469.1 hypothetical protein [Porticoccaceae bacterium]